MKSFHRNAIHTYMGKKYRRIKLIWILDSLHFCHKFSKKSVVWILAVKNISKHCTQKSQDQLKTPQLEFILGKPYWSSSSRENSWWQLAMNFPRRFSRSDNLALVTETRHTSKQMLCSIVSFEWFLMKCDAKASVLPSYLLLRCEIPTFFFQAKFVNMKSKGKNNTLSNLNIFVNVCKMNNR